MFMNRLYGPTALPITLAAPMVHDRTVAQNHLTLPNSARTIIPMVTCGSIKQPKSSSSNLTQQPWKNS
jgi:hypothetical protein